MTLPGYFFIPKTVTDHIHLGLWSASPSGFGVYGEPPYMFNHIQKRVPVFEAQSTFERAWDGTPFANVLKTSSRAIVFKNYRYQIRVSHAAFDLLMALFKNEVFLVDAVHCSATQDHSTFVKHYFFDQFDYDENLDPMLDYQIVNLVFLDMDTVPAI